VSQSISALISYFGSQTAAARALGVSQPTVSYWLSGQQKISPEKALLAQRLSSGSLSASDLCPLIAELTALHTLDKSSAISTALEPPPDGAVIPSSSEGAQ
jgi:DNA-binding transcriptional regulator YdaS (Cro superfamily)